MYQHYDQNDSFFTLHDCIAEQMSFAEGVLSFFFPDGFWVLPTHPQSNLSEIVRSDAARVDYRILDEELDGIRIYLFIKTKIRKVLRKEWEPKDFMRAVNSGIFQVEFITRYQGDQRLLYQCEVHSRHKPHFIECQIELPTNSTVYCWNHLRADRPW